MDVYELSATAVGRMTRVDIASKDREPDSPIGHFDFHGCICGVASFVGQPPWELHNGGDELLHILAGECEFTVLSGGGEDSRRLHEGDVVVVPQGCWHRSNAAKGVTMLFMTPREGGAHSWDDPRGQALASPGSRTTARRPPIGLRSRVTSPPSARARSRAMARPRPTPFSFWLRASSRRLNGLKASS